MGQSFLSSSKCDFWVATPRVPLLFAVFVGDVLLRMLRLQSRLEIQHPS